jgi:hypothetical protein
MYCLVPFFFILLIEKEVGTGKKNCTSSRTNSVLSLLARVQIIIIIHPTASPGIKGPSAFQMNIDLIIIIPSKKRFNHHRHTNADAV